MAAATTISRWTTPPDPGGRNPSGIESMTSQEPPGNEPAAVSPRLPVRSAAGLAVQPPTPRTRQLSHIATASPPPPPPSGSPSKRSSSRSRRQSNGIHQARSPSAHGSHDYPNKASPLSTAQTVSTTESVDGMAAAFSSSSHSPASLVAQRLREARAIYESEHLSMLLPEEAEFAAVAAAAGLHPMEEGATTWAPQGRKGRPSLQAATPTQSHAATSTRSQRSQSSQRGGTPSTATTPRSTKARRAQTPDPTHQRRASNSGSKATPRRSQTPDVQRGRTSVGEDSSSTKQGGFFRRIFRKGNKNQKHHKDDGQTVLSDSVATQVSRKSSASAKPQSRLAADEILHATSMPDVGRTTVRRSRSRSRSRGRTAKVADLTAPLPDDTLASATTAMLPRQQPPDERPEVFFAHDDVSTLTGPHMEADYGAQSQTPSQSNRYRGAGLSTSYSSSRDPIEQTYSNRGLSHNPSIMSADPMGFYHSTDMDPMESFAETATEGGSLSSPPAIDPFTEPFFTRGSRLQVITEPSPSPSHHHHDDPAGESPHHSGRRHVPRTTPPSRTLQDPSPRGPAVTPVTAHQDPVGASPVHQHDRGPSGVLDGHLLAPDPPLYHPEDEEDSAEEEKKEEEPLPSPAVSKAQASLSPQQHAMVVGAPPPPPPPPPPGGKKKSRRSKGHSSSPTKMAQRAQSPPPPPPPSQPPTPEKEGETEASVSFWKEETKRSKPVVFDSDTGEPVADSPRDEAARIDHQEERQTSVQPREPKAPPQLVPIETVKERSRAIDKQQAANSPPKTKKSNISSLARMNAKAVAYLHSLNGDPSPRHQWQDANKPESPVSDTSGIRFMAYSDKFKGRKLTTRAPSPRSASSGTPRAPKAEPQSPSWLGQPIERDVDITRSTVEKGMAIRRGYRDNLIAEGLATRVSPPPVVNNSKAQVFEPVQEPNDPIQRAGFRLLSKAAIPIQAEIRRFLAQQNAVDRMWALIEIQSYARRWRGEAHLIASRQAAITIQCNYKGYHTRATHYKRSKAAVDVQRMVRGYLSAVWAYSTVYSIILIQAQARRLAVQRTMAVEHAVLTNRAACRIQTAWRTFSVQRAFQFVVVDIVIVQCVVRSYLARQELKKCRNAIIDGAATVIQTRWRRFSAQMVLLYDLVHIIMVQSVVRRQLARRKLWKQEASALRIQTAWRGFWKYSHYIIMQYEACRIQGVFRGALARRQYHLAMGSCILIQSAFRQRQAKDAVVQTRQTYLSAYARASQMREVRACEKIQLWWSVVLECRKEKKAALVIERFFLTVRNEVEREVARYEHKRNKKGKKYRKKRESDEEMLERVWLNTVDENHVDVFALPTPTPKSYRPTTPDSMASSSLSQTPSSRQGGGRGSSRHQASSPSKKQVLRRDASPVALDSSRSTDSNTMMKPSFSFSSSHMSARLQELKDQTPTPARRPHLQDSLSLDPTASPAAAAPTKTRAADKYLKMYGGANLHTAPNRYSREFFHEDQSQSGGDTHGSLVSPAASLGGRHSLGNSALADNWRSTTPNGTGRKQSKAKATAQKYLQQQKLQQQPYRAAAAGPILGEEFGLI